jgi:hypothetical protein
MPSTLAYRLSRAQCEFLLHHVDGAKVPISHMYNFENPNEANTRRALMRQGLIQPTADKKATVYTVKGREILHEVCGLWADSLTRAGYQVDRGLTIPNRMTVIGCDVDQQLNRWAR